MWVSAGWRDYELLDCGGGERLERWGEYILVRPDPQAVWNTPRANRGWGNPSARYIRSSSGGGNWEIKNLPAQWKIGYDGLIFNVKPMNFKHTGIFPEQAVNWEWFSGLIARAKRPVSVLNLFAYTGAATLAAAKAGASVCHVDAARGMVLWGRENAAASGLADKPIRWIVDDCVKFVEREIKRGKRYDALIMDPPSYGRGPSGEIWKIEEQLYPLLELCMDVLSDNPLFVLINSYTAGLSPSVAGYMLGCTAQMRWGGHIECDEIGLNVTDTGLTLPCGSSGRWQAE